MYGNSPSLLTFPLKLMRVSLFGIKVSNPHSLSEPLGFHCPEFGLSESCDLDFSEFVDASLLKFTEGGAVDVVEIVAVVDIVDVVVFVVVVVDVDVFVVVVVVIVVVVVVVSTVKCGSVHINKKIVCFLHCS